MFGLVVLTNLVVALVLIDRRSVFDDAVAGRTSIFAVDDADQRVALASLLNLGCAVVAGILLSIWSLRAARNMVAVGATGVRPGWACGGWYIPIGNLWVPWMNLRRGHKSIGGTTTDLSWWQGIWVVSTVISFNTGSALDPDGATTDEVSRQLQTQGTFGVVQVVVVAAALGLAVRAMRAIDESTAARADG